MLGKKYIFHFIMSMMILIPLRLWAQQLGVDIISPVAQSCVNNGYDAQRPYQDNGILNGQNLSIRAVPVNLQIQDPFGTSLTVKLISGINQPKFPQPAPRSCQYTFGGDRQVQTAACGGKGYCTLLGSCTCFSNNDCGGSICNPQTYRCGCGVDADCGANQKCNSDGTCSCGNSGACAGGQQCLANGACSCSTNNDCGNGLLCSDGVCSELTSIDTANYSIDAAIQGETLPRSINFTADAPAGLIDAKSVTLKVEVDQVQNGGVFGSNSLATDFVSFRLDRSHPILSATPTIVSSLDGCRSTIPFNNSTLPAGFTLSDNQDSNPSFELFPNNIDGCKTTQRIKIADSCGNAQLVYIPTFRAPNPNEIQLALKGFRCFGLPCDTVNAPIFFQNGDTIGRGVVQTRINSPEGCYSSINSTVDRLNAQDQVLSSTLLFEQQLFEATPAQIVSSLEVLSSSGVIISNRGPFNIVDGSKLVVDINGISETVTFNANVFPDPSEALPIDVMIEINRQLNNADAVLLGSDLAIQTKAKGRSVLMTLSGNAAASLGFALGNHIAQGDGDGKYRATTKLYACNQPQPILSSQIEFTVTGGIKVDAGGPYLVNQGQSLQLSAAASSVPEEFGGISQIAWDLDNDGNFDRTGTFEELKLIDFDTKLNGVYQVRLQLTTGDGITDSVVTTVTVKDVNPSCSFSQAQFDIFEGSTLRLEAFNSVAADVNDPIISYEWTINAVTRTTAEPFIDHTFDQAGNYIVTLKVNDIDSSCSPIATATVNVRGVVPIIENLAVTTPTPKIMEGDMVTFSSGDTRAGSLNDPILAYTWDFGDGLRDTGAALIAPQHRYEQNGNYSICLTVRDSNDVIGPTCFPIVVEDLIPTATFTAPGSATEGEEITFDATGSMSINSMYDPLTKLVWDFGDGSAPVQTAADVMIVKHTFVRSGLLTVTLSVFDEDGFTSYEKQISVLDVAPTADFRIIIPNRGAMPPEGCEAADLGCEGEELTFNASNSRAGAPSDPIVKYRWNFGDNSTEIEVNTPTVTYAYADGGIAIVQANGDIQLLPSTFQVTLTVEDSDESTTVVSKTIDVANKAPTVEIAGNSSGEVAQPFNLRINVNDVSGDIPPAFVEWDMGDGTIYTSPSAQYPNPLTQITHTYAREGRFLINVSIQDGDGGEAVDSLEFISTPKKPMINLPTLTQVTGVNGQINNNPKNPIGEFVGNAVADNIYYVKEGELLVFEVPVISAVMSSGVLDEANAVFSTIPDGANTEYVPVDPAMGQPNAGSRQKLARFSWRPSYYDKGEYRVRLSVQGAVSDATNSADYIIRVIDAGRPMLAATSGNPRRGKVIFYDFDKENASLVFTPRSEIEIGLGAYDIEFDQRRQRAFASSPGSGQVVVMAVSDQPKIIRKIPTGSGAYDLQFGGDYLWVANITANTISAIHLQTLKVMATFKTQEMIKPSSLVYYQNESLQGRLAVGTLKGDLFVLDAQALINGQNDSAVLKKLVFGGSISKLTIDQQNMMSIANTKLRRLLQINAFDLESNDPEASIIPVQGLYFPIKDMIAKDNALWLTTGFTAYRAVDGVISNQFDIQANALGNLLDLTLEGPGISIFDANQRLANYRYSDSDSSIMEIIGLESTRIYQMVNFVYLYPN